MPRQPVRPPGRHRRARRGGMARRQLPPHPAPAPRPRHRRPDPRARPRRPAALALDRPPRPDHARSPGAAACSTSMPTPLPSTTLLGADPCWPRWSRAPRPAGPAHGRRAELAVRAVLGQQVSTAGGPHPRRPAGAPPTARPSRDPRRRAHPPVPLARGRWPTLRPRPLAMPRPAPQTLRWALAEPWSPARSTSAPAPTGTRPARQLAALPGVGPWTVETIAMRALGDPDAFPVTDLGVRRSRRAARLAPRALRCSPPAPSAGGRGGPTPSQHLWATATTPSTA